jgi:SAM-dependent methyltransferase
VVIGEPQPAIVALERSGWIRGSVLDPGCGTGEHTIHLTALGYDVRGIDSSEHAIEQARANAAERNVAAWFEVADALLLGNDQTRDYSTYDTVVDSALFTSSTLMTATGMCAVCIASAARRRWSTYLRCPTPGRA